MEWLLLSFVVASRAWVALSTRDKDCNPLSFYRKEGQLYVDPCSSWPCLNGGTCTSTDDKSSFSCTCAENFTGKYCQDKVDPCSSRPCLNGGTCTSTDDKSSFSCSCVENFTGIYCQDKVDPCSSLPCLNEGICTSTDDKTSLSCTCAHGFTGVYCQDKASTPGLPVTTPGCPSNDGPLGMEDGRIPDTSITASSYWKSFSSICSPFMARLNAHDMAWCSGKKDNSPWIQADLLTEGVVTGIITQGVPWTEHRDVWVTQYQVEYSSDGQSWYYVTDAENTPITFDGNTDATSSVTNRFVMALQTRYIRILPKGPTGYYGTYDMRLELLGCN